VTRKRGGRAARGSEAGGQDVGLTVVEKVLVVKLNAGGREVARYPGVVSSEECPAGWFAIETRWDLPQMEVAGLAFEPDDRLLEYFSLEAPFNAFRVIARDDSVRGIYGNVSQPARVEPGDAGTVIAWQDLYLDVVRQADGLVAVHDVNELEASGLADEDPELFALIEQTAAMMVELARAAEFPFHLPSG
jgi:hypothetical protein